MNQSPFKGPMRLYLWSTRLALALCVVSSLFGVCASASVFWFLAPYEEAVVPASDIADVSSFETAAGPSPASHQ